MKGPDHHFCMNPKDFGELVKSIRLAETMLGEKKKEPCTIESNARVTGRRYLAYSNDYESGMRVDENSVLIQRQSAEDLDKCNPLMPTIENIEEIATKPLTADVKRYQLISMEHFK